MGYHRGLGQESSVCAGVCYPPVGGSNRLIHVMGLYILHPSSKVQNWEFGIFPGVWVWVTTAGLVKRTQCVLVAAIQTPGQVQKVDTPG